MNGLIYLDNCATTKPCKEAVEGALFMMEECFGNPSSTHQLGLLAEREVENARKKISDVLMVSPDEIYFNSGGTEGANTAILGGANKKAGSRVVTTQIEHKAVLNAFKKLESEGFEVIYLKPDEKGYIDEKTIIDAVNEKTSLVSIMHVNNEIGSMLPIDKIGKLIKLKSPRCIFHVDAVQSFGKIPVYPAKWNIDALSVSAHKIHGIKGAGALYVKRGVNIKPIIYGGGQERGLRSGTLNTPAIVAFGKACEKINFEDINHVRLLRDTLVDYIKDLDVVFNSSVEGFPYILNVSFKNIRSEVMLNALSARGVYVSAASACAGNKESHVLSATGAKYAYSAIRISFSRDNTADEIKEAAKIIRETVKNLTI